MKNSNKEENIIWVVCMKDRSERAWPDEKDFCDVNGKVGWCNDCPSLKKHQK